MDPSQIEPLGDRVLVETIKERQVGSIVIPDQIAEGRPDRAKVLAVGPGARDPKNPAERIPVDVEVGDIVYFVRHAGTHIGGLSDDYVIFREQDIVARDNGGDVE